MIGFFSTPPPALQASTELSDAERLSFDFLGGSPSSIPSASINPGDGALIRVIVRHRATDGLAQTHLAPTTTLTNLHDFGSGVRFQKIWDSFNASGVDQRVTEWWGYSTGDTGAGTITGNFSGAVTNSSIEVFRYAVGWAAAPNGVFDTTEGAGTTWAATFGSAPVATSRLLMAVLQSSGGTTHALPAGWTLVTEFVTSFHSVITAKALGSVGAGPHTITDLVNVARAGGASEVLAA